MKALSTTVSGSAITVGLYPATVTPSLPTRQVTVGDFPAANPNWSRQIQISDEYVFIKRNTYAVAISLADLVTLALTQEVNLTWTPPVINNQPSNQSCVHSSTSATFTISAGSEYTLTYAWYELSPLSKSAATLTWGASAVTASGTTLTSNNTNVSDGNTVTIGEKVYTFKTALTPTEGEVLIGADADASLLNLIRAINHTGTPGTDYQCAAANTTVTAASSVTSHAFAVTPKALTTTGIYSVAAPGSLVITPTATTLTGTYYYVTVTDDAGSFGLTNGSVTSTTAVLTIT